MGYFWYLGYLLEVLWVPRMYFGGTLVRGCTLDVFWVRWRYFGGTLGALDSLWRYFGITLEVSCIFKYFGGTLRARWANRVLRMYFVCIFYLLWVIRAP